MAKKHAWPVYEGPALACRIRGFDFQGGSRLGFSMEEKGNEGVVGTKETVGSNLVKRLVEDDLYDKQMLPEKKRRLTLEQVSLLEKSFEEGNKLLPERKSELARKLGLNPRQIAIWFQNRKARWKTKQLERDYDQLKALYDKLLAEHHSLRANHDSILNDNRRLRHEVACLIEKLQAKEPIHDEIRHQWTPMVEATTLEPNARVGIEADASCAISPNPTKPKSFEDGAVNESHVSNVVVEDGELRLALESGVSYYLEPEDESYHRGHNYVIFSEEDGGGGNEGYFSDIYTNDGTIVVEHQPLHEEVEGGMGWWIWH